MRLSTNSIFVIKTAIHETFPGRPDVLLFGSRVDDKKRGGDIDLLIVDDLPQSQLEFAKIKALTKIHMKLGEQKIDMVVTPNPKADKRPVVRQAMEQGIIL